MGRKGRKYSSLAERLEDDAAEFGDAKPALSEACAVAGDSLTAALPREQADDCDDEDEEERIPELQAKASASPVHAPTTAMAHDSHSRSQQLSSLTRANTAPIMTPGGPNKENSSALAESVMFPGGSSRSVASLDTESDRRIMSAAATIGGTAGMLLLGPVSGVALGTAAAYATTRDSRTGIVARNASAAYLHVSDKAVDKGLQAVERALDEGCKRLSKSIDPATVPTALRPVLQTLTDCPGPARAANSEEARQMRVKYPDRVPVFCERSPYSDLPEITKRKFAVPGTMLCGEFKYIVHKLVLEAGARNTKAEKTIYIFVNGITPKTSTPMSELYEQLRAADGFLHVRYCAENTLG